MTGILILIGSFTCSKKAKLMDMILDKFIFQNRFLCFQSDMLLVDIGIVSLRQFQCAPTAYVHSVNR